jgi:hypothetical protein
VTGFSSDESTRVLLGARASVRKQELEKTKAAAT